MQHPQLVRALTAAAAIAAAGCGSPRSAHRPAATPEALQRLEAGVPAAVKRDAQRTAAALGRRHMRVDYYRGRRFEAVRTLAPRAPEIGQDGPVIIATFTGRVVYRRARVPAGQSRTARGRFAYATYGPTSTAPLDFGVLPAVPSALR